MKDPTRWQDPISLSAETERIAAPVRLDDLAKVELGDFTIGQIVKKASEKMTGIRYENSKGEGVYEALRKQDPNIHKALLKTRIYNWLRKPESYPKGAKAYFTDRGDRAYRNKTLQTHRGTLKHDIQRKVEEIDPKNIVYRDEHQMIVKKAASNLYRDRVEVIALKDGKPLAGFYPKQRRTIQNVAFPGGGVDPGERLEEAAKREFKEETGYKITNVRPAGIDPLVAPWSPWIKKSKDPEHKQRMIEFPNGTRTNYVIADVVANAKRLAPPEPAPWLKTFKPRPLDEVLKIQEKALKAIKLPEDRDRLGKRLEVLNEIKKQAFAVPEGLVTGAVNSLDDIVLAAWNIHKRQQRQAMGLPPEPESPIYTQHLAQKEASLVSEIANRAKGLLTRTSGAVMQHAPLIEETMGNLATGGVGDAAVSLVPTALRKIPKFLDNVFYGKPVNFEQLYKQKDLPLGVAYGRKDYNQTVQALPAKKR